MKISIDFDCTPEEARRLVGLPDLTPVHQLYVERMQKAVTDGMSPEHFADLMKNWGPMSEAAMGTWRAVFEQMAGPRK